MTYYYLAICDIYTLILKINYSMLRWERKEKITINKLCKINKNWLTTTIIWNINIMYYIYFTWK